MIDPYATYEDAIKYGPGKISYHFKRSTLYYTMVIQLMIWLQTDSSKEVISHAISELYASEKSKRTPKKHQ